MVRKRLIRVVKSRTVRAANKEQGERRGNMNAVEIEEAITALAEQPFDPAEFPFAFLQAFGNKETTLKRLRKGESNKSDLGGVLQTSNIHIAVAPKGETAKMLAALRSSSATARAKAKFILTTDGEQFEAEDLAGDAAPIACAYGEFPDHFGYFLPLAGITTVQQVRESSFDIRATSRLNRLYIELRKDNPAWDTAERRHDMNNFMARLIFCFFAEDTDIFPGGGLFTTTVEQMSSRDSSNTHEVIKTLFLAMNTRREDRESAGIPRWADRLPYVNGGLFSGDIDVPKFSKIARSYLLHIGSLDWTRINPDIFGSMIQAVAEDEERGALGMHYTSVPNILKVLNPLFLDDLRAKLAEAGTNSRTLLNLRKRMSRIRVFDPACGSGNFLVIAYKEMRAIEAALNERRGEKGRRSEIPLTNFRGILRQSKPIVAGQREIEKGDFFILDGIMLYVADVGDAIKKTAGEIDSRLRVIFANGTESDLLSRSLQRAFYNDPAARRIVSPESGQTSFGDTWEADDVESGTIYVLESLSDNPYVVQNKQVLHKIGVTGGKVETRIANAIKDATFLLAEVEVVATYKLAGINRTKLENLLHRFFDPARLNVEIKDRFGNPVEPREWFLVPITAVDEAVERIRDGTITKYRYDPKTACLKRTD